MVDRQRTLDAARDLIEAAKKANRVEPLDHARSHIVRPRQMSTVLEAYDIGYGEANPRTKEERYTLERDLYEGRLRLVVELREDPAYAVIVAAIFLGSH